MTTYRTVRRPSRRTGRLGLASSVLLGLIASACLIWQTSAAAYTSSTGGPADSWETGSVHLDDDGGGAAMFTVRGLRPGMTGTHCITVSSTGTVPSTVRLYGTPPAATNDLDQHVQITVAEGNGGSFGSCTGFSQIGGDLHTGALADFPTTFAGGLGTWAPAGTTSTAETRTYRFTYLFDANAPDSTQNSTASVTFTWEAQSR